MADVGGLSSQEINRIMDLEWEESVQEWEWYALNYVNPIPPLIAFPSYCVSRRCGWCRFVIKPGEIVTARSSAGTESSAFAFGDSFDDTKLFATFKRCESDHNTCATTGYHVECSTIASSLGLRKNAFLDVARYSYEPPAKEDGLRQEWILNHLNQLMSNKFTKLPTEILFMINKHLILHYAIASLSGLRRPSRCTIEPLKDVWATHFSLNGVEYIASLSNAPRPGGRLLWKASESHEDQYLYFSEDHLGIRQIVDDPAVVSTKESRPGWWRTLPIMGPNITCFDDGLKLRSVAATPLSPNICWPYPMTPTSLKKMAYHVTKKPSSNFGMTIEARMVALGFNEPGIIAYSACWYGDRLINIHSHESGESLGFYRELEEDIGATQTTVKRNDVSSSSTLYWVYHPLNPGEKVEQVWLRTKNEPEEAGDPHARQQKTVLSSLSEIAIALLTSHSRTLIMGKPNAMKSEWKCIAQTFTASPMRVFFHPSADGIPLFAAATVGGCGKEPMAASLPTWLDAGKNPEDLEVSLEGVKDIVACKETGDKGKAKVSGLLLRYEDGKQASVGRFRLDRVEAPLSVDGSSCMYIGSRLSNEGDSVVERISMSAPENAEGLEWDKVPLEGNFSWRVLFSKTADYSCVGS